MDRPGGTASRLLGLGVGLAIVAALSLAQRFFIPLFLSGLLALLLAPLVARLERVGIPHVPSVILVTLVAFLAISGTALLVAGQVSTLGRKLPQYKENLRSKAAALRGPLGLALDRAENVFRDVEREFAKGPGAPKEPGASDVVKVEVVPSSPSALNLLRDSLGALLGVLASAVVIVVLVVFFLIYHGDIRDRVLRLVGDNRVNLTTRTITEATERVSRYLVVQSSLNGAFGLVLGGGLYLLGVPNAWLWGFVGGLFRFIPYLGSWLAAAMPVLLSLAVFDTWSRPLMVVGLVATLETLWANALEPWTFGARTGLSPLAVVLSAFFWAWLWGGTGLLLSTPIAVCLLTLGERIPQLDFLTVLLGHEPALEPRVRLYHRLLASDAEEAGEILEAESRGRTLADLLDSLLVPALAMVERDRQQGRLGDEPFEAICATARELAEDRRELPAGKAEGRPVPPAPEELPGRALCLPAGDQADELIGSLLAELLVERGIRAETVAAPKTVGEKVEAVSEVHPDVILISALPPPNRTQTRYLHKRLRRRFPSAPIIIGLWTAKGDLSGWEGRLDPSGGTFLAVTLEQARSKCYELVQPLVLERRLHGGGKAAG
jgi:predicted PurR-regulated permease PerM